MTTNTDMAREAALQAHIEALRGKIGKPIDELAIIEDFHAGWYARDAALSVQGDEPPLGYKRGHIGDYDKTQRAFTLHDLREVWEYSRYHYRDGGDNYKKNFDEFIAMRFPAPKPQADAMPDRDAMERQAKEFLPESVENYLIVGGMYEMVANLMADFAIAQAKHTGDLEAGQRIVADIRAILDDTKNSGKTRAILYEYIDSLIAKIWDGVTWRHVTQAVKEIL